MNELNRMTKEEFEGLTKEDVIDIALQNQAENEALKEAMLNMADKEINDIKVSSERVNELSDNIYSIERSQKATNDAFLNITDGVNRQIEFVEAFGKSMLSCENFKFYVVENGSAIKYEQNDKNEFVDRKVYTNSMIHQALATQNAVVYNDLIASGITDDVFQSNGVKSAAVIPLVKNGEVVAVLEATNTTENLSFDMRDVAELDYSKVSGRQIDSYIWHTSNNIKREFSEYEAKHDKLTGLYKREGLVEQLSKRFYDLIGGKGGEDIENAQKFTLMLGDGDKFKTINDTFGHIAGDAAINLIADAYVRAGGDNCIPYRFGGDEMGFLYIGDEKKCLEVAERARQLVAETPIFVSDEGKKADYFLDGIPSGFEHDGDVARLTISGGVKELDAREFFKCYDGRNIDIEMLERALTDNGFAYADRNLYCAKALGGNRIIDNENYVEVKKDKDEQSKDEPMVYEVMSYVNVDNIQTLTSPLLVDDIYMPVESVVASYGNSNNDYIISTDIVVDGKVSVQYKDEIYEDVNYFPSDLLADIKAGHTDLYQLSDDSTFGYYRETNLTNSDGVIIARLYVPYEQDDFSRRTLSEIHNELVSLSENEVKQLVQQFEANKEAIAKLDIPIDIKQLAMSDNRADRQKLFDMENVPKEVLDVLKNDVDGYIAKRANEVSSVDGVGFGNGRDDVDLRNDTKDKNDTIAKKKQSEYER